MNYQEAIDKAAKLLRKGNNAATSQEESASFLAKAQEIISQYRLDIDDLNYEANQTADDNEPVADFGYADPLDNVKYGQYRESWTVRLASLVSYHNQCVIRYRRTEDKGSIIKVIGRPSDVAATRYLYGYFRQQIEQLSKEGCKGHSTAYKGEFATGCIDTLRRKLEAQTKTMVEEVKAKHIGNTQALVKVDNAIIRIEKRREDVDDFLNSWVYETLAERIDVSLEQAKMMYKFRYTDAEKLFATKADWEAALARYDAYKEEQAKLLKGYKPGRGTRGFDGAGSRTTTGGREAGQKAGERIRMTGAKGSLGGGTKQIS